jgi:hypothetical protein
MKMRRPGVRIEDQRGNPVSFFQLKDMTELEARKEDGSLTLKAIAKAPSWSELLPGFNGKQARMPARSGQRETLVEW